MSCYFDNALWVIGDNVEQQIPMLLDDGWDVEYQSDKLLILSSGGNYHNGGIPLALPTNLVAVLYSTNEMVLGHYLGVAHLGDYMTDYFGPEKEYFESTTDPTPEEIKKVQDYLAKDKTVTPEYAIEPAKLNPKASDDPADDFIRRLQALPDDAESEVRSDDPAEDDFLSRLQALPNDPPAPTKGAAQLEKIGSHHDIRLHRLLDKMAQDDPIRYGWDGIDGLIEYLEECWASREKRKRKE